MRLEYETEGIDEADFADDPITQFRAWLAIVVEAFFDCVFTKADHGIQIFGGSGINFCLECLVQIGVAIIRLGPGNRCCQKTNQNR